MGNTFIEKIRESLSFKLSESIKRESVDPLNKKYFRYLRNRVLFWGAVLIIFWLILFFLYTRKAIDMKNFPEILVISIGLYIVVIIAHIYALALSYVYHDAKRREMPPTLWFLVCLLVPYLLGFILYLMVRNPLPLTCPKCYQPVPRYSKYCPNCGFQLRPSCPECGAPVPENANFCPQCGVSLKA